jgi:DNA-binding winged helix-turn-helix (wHTH) protein/TolB-like protein
MGERTLYEFEGFRLDAAAQVLLRDGVPVALPPKALDTLVALVERRGAIVGKEELLAVVWPDVFVEENNLTQYISLLRKTLGDDAQPRRFIETVPRRGYRWCCAMECLAAEADELEPGARDAISRDRAEEALPGGGGTAPVPGRRRPRWLGWRVAALAMAGVGVASGLLVWGWRADGPVVSASSGPVSVAVLPFAMNDREAAEADEGLALADELIRQLRDRRTGLEVRSVNAIYRYADGPVDPAQAARELGVDLVVAAQVETAAGTRPVVRVRLVGARAGSTVWQREFKDDGRGLLAVDDAAAHALETALAATEGPVRRRVTEDLRAYGAFVRGRMEWERRTSQGIYRSIDAMEQAVDLDPRFALAYAGLADAYAFDLSHWLKAEGAAQRALALDPGLGEAHAALGLVKMLWRGDRRGAADELKAAIRLAPRYASAHEWYADTFAMENRMLEATAEMQNAAEVDPDSVAIATDLARMAYLRHDFKTARAQCLAVLVGHPGYVQGHILMQDIYMETREYGLAMREVAEVDRLLGWGGAQASAETARENEAFARDGIRGFWAARAQYLETEFTDPYQAARYLARLGRREQALMWLAQAEARKKAGKAVMLYAFEEPVFDGLRNDTRFRRLVEPVE